MLYCKHVYVKMCTMQKNVLEKANHLKRQAAASLIKDDIVIFMSWSFKCIFSVCYGPECGLVP